MGDTNINIGTVNISGGAERIGEIMSELARGVSAEALADNGEQVPEGAEDVIAQQTGEEAPTKEEQEARILYLVDENEAEEARMLDRRTNLERVLERSEEYGNRRGHLRTSDRKPNERQKIQTRQRRARKQAQESLELACEVCTHAGKCALKGNFDKWFDTKPYKDKGSIPKYFRPQVKIETRSDFRADMASEPEPHCDPKAREKIARAKKAA